ncbi:MAG: hypothetical protein ACJ73S_14245 [Mycobacteriales bacterium]
MGIFRRSGELSRHEYARRVLAEVERAGAAEAWYDSDAFAVRFRREAGGEVVTINLATLYQEATGMDQGERDALTARFAADMVAPPAIPEDWERVAPLLRPVVRPATFGLGAGGLVPLSRPFLPYLRELVVIDQPTVMAYVNRDKPAAWGVPAAEVFATARANVARFAALADEPPAAPALLRFVDDGDGYFAARLLLDGWLAGLAGRVGGRPVAFVPDQNTLLVTGDQPDTLGSLFELVEAEYREAARAVSPAAYTVDDAGRVVPYAAPVGHPVGAAVHRAEVVLAATEYAAQGEELNKRHQNEGADIFVANLLAAGRDDGSLFTVASWADGVETLLPEADFVAFPGEDTFYAGWDEVARTAGLEPVDGLYPPRYHVRGWPPAAVVDQLRALATAP